MMKAEQHPEAPPMRRWRALLVLGLLAGLLAMHALAPGGTVHEHAGPQHTTAVHMTAAAVSAHDDCAGDGGHCGGGPLHHADPACAAAAVSGAPALPALAPGPVAAPVHADAVRSYATGAPDGSRAPPSLAELQLLRI
ncbi:DUF6153 family protein [Streptomyces aurantiogriseus]|uniref:Uncharacterized protein n=1 Tax=Streptomyces aurantiogriseus TaxID=66870 RepID=A0A918FI18_9ACTN|nr:DUF6153 family protein [Streptomyces aurantiogriseus]GGR38863.1 hypothetical protein GCM10010251_64330 [Streptomyces aurantiogriseus]